MVEHHHSGGDGKRASFAEMADKNAENAVLRFAARWSMVTLVPGLLSILVVVIMFAGSRILSQIEKTSERQERLGESLTKMETQIRIVTETQLPAVTTILNERLSAQADRILRVEKLVDEEFKHLKLNDMKQNERLERLMERLYKYQPPQPPVYGPPRASPSGAIEPGSPGIVQ